MQITYIYIYPPLCPQLTRYKLCIDHIKPIQSNPIQKAVLGHFKMWLTNQITPKSCIGSLWLTNQIILPTGLLSCGKCHDPKVSLFVLCNDDIFTKITFKPFSDKNNKVPILPSWNSSFYLHWRTYNGRQWRRMPRLIFWTLVVDFKSSIQRYRSCLWPKFDMF